MNLPRTPCLASIVLAAAALLVAGAPAVDASGGKKTYEDKQRGFRVSLGEKFEQVPPKLTPDTAFIVGDWYADAAKFKGGDKPEFLIFWFATPKGGVVTPSGGEKPKPKDAPPETPEETAKRKHQEEYAKSTDQYLDQFFTRNLQAFGGGVPNAKDIWKTAEKTKTKTPGVEALYAEINDPEDRKGKKLGAAGRASQACAAVGKLVLDRPQETIEVGFIGFCGMEFWKDAKKDFKDTVKSFEDLAKIATDSQNLGAQKDLDPEDADAFRKAIKQTKLIKGWQCIDTPHYVVLYDTEVDPGLAKKVGEQLESLRAQVYEVLFPPDKPIKAISLVRVCKDREQYFAYGGPPSSAGYWAWEEMELVFYEDHNAKNDSFRVLYHEGFHQFIHYSVGKMDPHSWFNEGTGDYFFGFNNESGKWTRAINMWRRDLAKKAKREHRFPDLWEWLHWTQMQYYGKNNFGLGGGENYALGWSFIYFLHTTKKPEYQGILERYFNTLKGCVTLARETREADDKAKKAAEEKAKLEAEEKAKRDAEEKAKKDAAPPAPADPAKPGDPPKPADPAKPSDPPAPVDPPKSDAPPPPPADPVKPPDPAPPAPPADPAKPADPPATPPVAPAAPTPPADPTKPSDPTKPAAPPKEDPKHREIFNELLWLDKALDAAFKGVDMKQLEKDWLNAE